MAEIIYHYTTASGLLGILDTRTIWCTHVSYLNDTLEYKHGVYVYQRTLQSIVDDDELSSDVRSTAKTALEVLVGHTSIDALLDDPRRFYVASFSARDDDLSQWRAYGGSGPRFAIGFCAEELRKLHRMSGMRLEPVRYDSNKEMVTLRAQVLSRLQDLLHRGPTQLGTESDARAIPLGHLFALSQDSIASLSPLVKHDAFVAEAEYRLFSSPNDLMSQPPPTPKFRSGKSYLIPYLALDLSALDRPVVSITVGPTAHPAEAKAAVVRLLKFKAQCNPGFVRIHSHGYEVNSSAVPYRDW